MVHAPGLARLALQTLRDDPPAAPLVLVEGHTHEPSLETLGTVTVLNPGSVGGGGTGNLADTGGAIGLARLTFTRLPSFVPRAADLVEIDPGDGTAQARRLRLDPAA
jgi:diadenosine tetraphosphatase ApaH/serine/threonine PP2A family protein phosphatase